MCGDHRLLLLVNEPGRREAEAGAVHAASTEGSREATGTSGAADSTHSAGTGHYSEELGLLQREDTAFLYFSKQFSPTFYYSFYFKTLFETFEILWEVMTEFKLKHEYFKDTTLDQYLIAVCENIGLKTRFVGFFFFFFFFFFCFLSHLPSSVTCFCIGNDVQGVEAGAAVITLHGRHAEGPV